MIYIAVFLLKTVLTIVVAAVGLLVLHNCSVSGRTSLKKQLIVMLFAFGTIFIIWSKHYTPPSLSESKTRVKYTQPPQPKFYDSYCVQHKKGKWRMITTLPDGGVATTPYFVYPPTGERIKK